MGVGLSIWLVGQMVFCGCRLCARRLVIGIMEVVPPSWCVVAAYIWVLTLLFASMCGLLSDRGYIVRSVRCVHDLCSDLGTYYRASGASLLASGRHVILFAAHPYLLHACPSCVAFCLAASSQVSAVTSSARDVDVISLACRAQKPPRGVLLLMVVVLFELTVFLGDVLCYSRFITVKA